MKNKRIIPVIVVVVIVVGVTIYFEMLRYSGKNDNRIEGSGVIEVTEVEVARLGLGIDLDEAKLAQYGID